jgi:hypothetical protein
MQTLLDTLLQTPWWVYLLLVLVVFRGLKATRPSVFPYKKVFILPVILIYLSVHSLLALAVWTNNLMMNATLMLLVGIATGWLVTQANKIQVDREHGLIKVRGSWFTLILILLIFGVKYYIGYTLGSNPAAASDAHFLHFVFAANGFLIGILVGRVLHYTTCYYRSDSVDLSAEMKPGASQNA